MTTSSTSVGITENRMLFMCAVGSLIVVICCIKCCVNVVTVVKKYLQHTTLTAFDTTYYNTGQHFTTHYNTLIQKTFATTI